MKVIRHFIFATLLSLGILSVTFAQNIILTQAHETGIYNKGEKIRVTVFLNDKSYDSITVRIWKNFSKQHFQKRVRYLGDTLVIFNDKINSPGSVIFEVTTKSDTASIGSIVDPDKFISGTKRPKDFDEFWELEKRKLRQLPMDVKAIQINEIEKSYVCSDMEINCTGSTPARGYFAGFSQA